MFDFLSFKSPASFVKTLAGTNPVHFWISFAETPTSITFAKADSNGDVIARYDQSYIIHKKNTASQVPEKIAVVSIPRVFYLPVKHFIPYNK